MTKKEQCAQARLLRQQGLALSDIAERLGVAKSSVSSWLRDIVLTDEQVEHLIDYNRRMRGQNNGAQASRKKFSDLRKQYREQGRQKARENRSLHLAGCMLYWAEGAKRRNSVIFANSDANMMTLFIDT
jgi:transcriptional regulator with XRE-family HTH domain